MVDENPKHLLDTLLLSATQRKAKSLQLIFDICEELERSPGKNLTIASVGRLSQERGGPGAPALRNAAGEHYRMIIEAFAKRNAGKKGQTSGKAAELDEILEGVSDQVLRTRVSMLLAELTSCRAQILALRHIANQSSVLDLRTPPAQKRGEQVEAGLGLTEQEMAALKAAIDPETMKHWGWKEHTSGRVTSESGQIVFRAGFTTAIAKVIAFCGT